jgi:hypothetical protein
MAAGSRIAEAYVQIIPTTKGIGQTISKEFGGVGAASGKAMGGGMLSAAKRFAGPLAAVFGTTAIIGFAKNLVRVGEAQATADARIGQIAKSMDLFGDGTDVVTGRLRDLARATAANTGVDQNSIKATQSKLLTFKEIARSADVAGGAFDRATDAAVDLAAAGFGTAETNAIQLGKALNDPIKGISALSRSGVTFTEQEQERIKTLVESNQLGEAQALILAAIESQVSGTAEATANSSDKMREGWLNVQQSLAEKVLPIFDRFASFMIDTVFPVLIELGDGLPGLAGKMGDAFKPILDAIIPVFLSLFDAVKPLLPTIIELAANFSPLALVLKIVTPILTALLPALQKLLPPLLEIVMAILPIFVMLVEALAPILVIVAEVIAFLLVPMIDVLAFQLGILAGVVTWLVTDVVVPMFNFFAERTAMLVDQISDVFGFLGGFFAGLWSGIGDGFKAFINFIIDGINGFIGGINGVAGFISDITGGAISVKIGELPRLADGGIVSAGGGGILANIGEGRYDEAVMPLGGPQLERIREALGSGAGDVYVQNPFTGEYLLARVDSRASGVVSGVLSGMAVDQRAGGLL